MIFCARCVARGTTPLSSRTMVPYASLSLVKPSCGLETPNGATVSQLRLFSSEHEFVLCASPAGRKTSNKGWTNGLPHGQTEQLTNDIPPPPCCYLMVTAKNRACDALFLCGCTEKTGYFGRRKSFRSRHPRSPRLRSPSWVLLCQQGHVQFFRFCLLAVLPRLFPFPPNSPATLWVVEVAAECLP